MLFLTPRSSTEPTNKRAIPYLLFVIGAKRQPVVTRSQGQNAAIYKWRYLLACPSYREAALTNPKNFSRSPGWQPASNPLRICRKPYRSELRPSRAHTSHVENHLVLDLLYLTIPSPFAHFIMSLVRVFAPQLLKYFSIILLVNRKPIDKTTESIIISTCCTLR